MAAIRAAADSIRPLLPGRPCAAIVLGSGLSAAGRGRLLASVPFSEIPGFPLPSVEGHCGTLEVRESGGAVAAYLSGRVHLYEGFSPHEVVFPVRVMAALGIPNLILTNAAGGIRNDLEPGDLMLIRDHLDLTGQSPLDGPNIDALGPRFPDMTSLWHPGLLAAAAEAAAAAGSAAPQGVYAGVRGPAYETPAEIEMLRRLGADAVGMSTVHEAVAAGHAGMRVLGLSVIANRAAIAGRRPLTHGEVLERSGRAAKTTSSIIEAVLARIAAGL